MCVQAIFGDIFFYEEVMDELLRLTRENNEMLKRICAWLDKVESPAYRDSEDMREFAQNLLANMLIERRCNNNNNQQIFWR